MAKVSFALVVCLVLLFVIAISEVEGGTEPNQCLKKSKTYSGKCDEAKENIAKCAEACKSKEKAVDGNCKNDGSCMCIFKCPAPPATHTKPTSTHHHGEHPLGDGGN